MQSKIKLAQKRVFDYIQTLQQKTREERKQIYDMIKQIDDQINLDQENIHLIKDKEIRKELMDQFLTLKQ